MGQDDQTDWQSPADLCPFAASWIVRIKNKSHDNN
jgi:hypothetical protein